MTEAAGPAGNLFQKIQLSSSAYVLAGGLSERMGTDKALLEIGGGTLLRHVVEQARTVTSRVAIVGSRNSAVARKHPEFVWIEDCFPGQGPLAGTITALRHTSSRWNLLLACDMPFLTSAFLKSLLERAAASDGIAVVPTTSDFRRHPLCAVYRADALANFEEVWRQGQRSMMAALRSVAVVEAPVLDSKLLANLNTPADWQSFLAAKPGELMPNGDFPHYIEFRHVSKTFDRPILVDCSFAVDSGETIAIIGRSGVGKSVSLGHIMGFLKPDSGRVIVAHQDITDMPEAELRKIRKKVTMVFQNGALFDSLTVAENILFSLELRDDYDEKNKEEVVNGLLTMVDLVEDRDTYPADLSTGYKRAVAIARALAAQPECILYDEPTTMVDPIMSNHLGDLMLRLKEQLHLTSVVVTHDLDLMRKVADKVIFLFESKIIYFGPVSELHKSTHEHIKEFLAMDRVEM